MKFITAKLSATIDNELFSLKTHAATDLRCYDVLKDIQSLENYVRNKRISLGYSIVLTNVKSPWKAKKGEKENYYNDFRIYEELTAHGTMDWKPGVSKGTKKVRIDPIKLAGKYTSRWAKYKEAEQSKEDKSNGNNLFKYAINTIDR